MNVKEILRKHLVELREKNSWTQSEIASRLNISQRTYSHYENGSRNIPLEVLVDIANLYEVNVDFLVRK